MTSADRKTQLTAAGLKLGGTRIPAAPFIFEAPAMLGEVECAHTVVMGRHSYMNSGLVRSATEIGRYCSIGRDVTIGTGTHDHTLLSTSPALAAPDRNVVKYADAVRRKRVVIEHDVWIGDRAIIMTGVTVGTGAIIAAGAIVTKDVTPYSIVGGIPAAPIRERFPADLVEPLLKSRWWEVPQRLLLDLPFTDVPAFCEAIVGYDGPRETFPHKPTRI
ncbi:CatB-related O-acetyltransferase [Neoaquamicrobium sediminum]|uniref:CatB-related O-acetyltransferase n=1 Tax=Neoaquamicrobium sediminum TaxID=1849104 RepID=A0ABV3X0H2_9HYPH